MLQNSECRGECFVRVLVGCEFSGEVRDAFRAHGHEAWSCDLEDVEPEGLYPEYHLRGDVRWFLPNWDTPSSSKAWKWDLFICHPPCTFLCCSGSRWLYEGGRGRVDREPKRWFDMQRAALFFRQVLDTPVPRVAVENPVMHKHARDLVGRGHDQLIQPWQFGHGEIKATCFWLRGLPKLSATKIVTGRTPRVHHAYGPGREKERSRTLHGIAGAMAAQWGDPDIRPGRFT